LERRRDAIARAAATGDSVLAGFVASANAVVPSATGNSDNDLIPAMISLRGSDLGLEGSVYLGNDLRMAWTRTGSAGSTTNPSVASRRLQEPSFISTTEHAEGSGFQGGSILSWTHNQVVVVVPEGQGLDLPILLESGAAGSGQQAATAELELRVRYAAPSLVSMSPTSVPTDGCHQWERVTAANRGADPSTGLPVRLCC